MFKFLICVLMVQNQFNFYICQREQICKLITKYFTNYGFKN